MTELTLHVNGAELRVRASADEPLLWVLRNRLRLTGTKYGCGEGQCGACTVMIDGVATRSCQTGVTAVAGRHITTIEGLEQHGKLHPLQEAFLEIGAMQCGYCTSGMIVSGAALLAKNSNPSEPEILAAMDGNMCRCGTYPRIVAAVQRASQKMKNERAAFSGVVRY